MTVDHERAKQAARATAPDPELEDFAQEIFADLVSRNDSMLDDSDAFRLGESDEMAISGLMPSKFASMFCASSRSERVADRVRELIEDRLLRKAALGADAAVATRDARSSMSRLFLKLGVEHTLGRAPTTRFDAEYPEHARAYDLGCRVAVALRWMLEAARC